MSESAFRAWNMFLLRAPLGGADGIVPDHTPPNQPVPGDLPDLLERGSLDLALREAILLASPVLDGTLERIAQGGAGHLRPAQQRRVWLSILRYRLRRQSRPTPFGVFAGVCAGGFDSAAKLQWGPDHRTRTHVDMQWLSKVVHRLESDPAVLPVLDVQAHPALVRRDDRVVLDCPSALGRPPAGPTRTTVSVRHSPLVAEILEAATRPTPAAQVGEQVAARFGVPAERVGQVLAVLVAEEILTTGLRPPLDGSDPLRHVLALLDRVPADPTAEWYAALELLREIDRSREEYDRLPVGRGEPHLREMIRTAHRLDDHPTPFHVDTRLDIEARLPDQIRAEVEQAADLMWRLSRDKLGLFALREYHGRFLERYGSDRLVPVLELLDAARGLGAPAGYGWPLSEAGPQAPPPPDDTRHARIVHRIVAEAIRDRRREVELTDDLVAQLSPPGGDPRTVPDSCEVTVHVISPSVDALAAGDFRVVLSASPGSHRAGSTFARFADLLPHRSALADACASVPVRTQDALAADIAFLPRAGKAANLAHTVPHTGRRISIGVPAADGVEEILLRDIAIGATLDRLRAVHLPTGREIVPSLGNVVSPVAQAPNVARLLWEIGLEGQRLWEPWQWGAAVDSPFVPRIRRGRFVLAPAVWRLDVLRDALGRDAEGFALAVARWRAEWDVPARVLVVSQDQRLLLDLTDRWHRELLHDEIRKDVSLVAQEVPDDGPGTADGIGGHVMEIVVPLVRRRTVPDRAPVAVHEPARRICGVGSEWLFLKLYTPSQHQDVLLTRHLSTLVDLATAHGADRWFFIRYTDPDGHHLRVRFHGSPQRLWGEAVPELGRALDEWRHRGLLAAVRTDEYDPEFERYGGAGVLTAAEEVFQQDSRAALDLLALALPDRPGADLDLLTAVSVASLATAFGPPGNGDEPAGDHSEDPAAAWLSRTGSRRALPDLYRKDPARWRRLVDPVGDWPGLREESFGPAALAALRPRDEAVRRLRAALDGATADGADPRRPPRPLGRIVGSLMHMTCNRLFGGDTERETTLVAVARGAVQDNRNRRRHLA